MHGSFIEQKACIRRDIFDKCGVQDSDKRNTCICTTCFNFKPLCVLSIQCSNVNIWGLQNNSSYFSKQHNRLIFIMKTLCFLLAWNWVKEYLQDIKAVGVKTNISGDIHTVFKHISPLIPSSCITAPEGVLWYHTFTKYARCELECFWTDSLT